MEDDDDGPPPLVPDDGVPTSSATGGDAAFGGMADMLRGMGGGAGGLPDIAGLMNNPQMMAMAQQLAANGGLASLMQNPAVANMVRRLRFNINIYLRISNLGIDGSRSIR